jgi:hypothetical protein
MSTPIGGAHFGVCSCLALSAGGLIKAKIASPWPQSIIGTMWMVSVAGATTVRSFVPGGCGKSELSAGLNRSGGRRNLTSACSGRAVSLNLIIKGNGAPLMPGVRCSRVCAQSKEVKAMIRRAGLASALALCGVAVSQLPVTSVSAYRTPEPEGFPSPYHQERSEAEYRIKPKDELDIRIEGACIYSTRFEVDERGIIELPFADEVQAAGMTAAELASELTRQLGKYLKDPKVHVRVIGGRT